MRGHSETIASATPGSDSSSPSLALSSQNTWVPFAVNEVDRVGPGSSAWQLRVVPLEVTVHW